MNDEICMTPPPLRSFKESAAAPRRIPQLLTRNTGKAFDLTPEEFNKAKDIPWFEIGGEIMTRSGVKLREYLDASN